jgi:hypothetical protein
LNHEWFQEVPLPKPKEFMPTFHWNYHIQLSMPSHNPYHQGSTCITWCSSFVAKLSLWIHQSLNMFQGIEGIEEIAVHENYQ